MIGSLIFYGLYPLTRLLNRVSEPLRKLPSACINGKEVWDGGGVPSRRFTKAQTAQLDQWLSKDSGPPEAREEPRRETGEGLKEEAPGEENSTEAEEVKAVVPEEPREEAGPEKGDVYKVVKEEQGEEAAGSKGGLDHRAREDVPQEEAQETTIRPEELQREEVVEELNLVVPVVESNDSSSARVQMTETPELQDPSDSRTEESASEDTGIISPLEEQTKTLIMGESVAQALAQVLADAPQPEGAVAAGDHWVEPYADPGELHAGICGPLPLDLVTLLAEAEAHSQPVESHARLSQTGWHFPVGPGLGDVVHCPLWQIPGMSYYPTLQENVPFEVVWRVWEDVSAAEPLQGACKDPQALFDFTVMSYNILAQDLLEANEELYEHCPLVLGWNYRLPVLLEELHRWEPDILCLQEVQENHYNEELHPALHDMGYTCVYKRRTGFKTDGCAVCYRGDRFSKLSVSLVEFFRPESELLDRDNVGVVLLLQPLVTQGSEVTAKGPPLCVANTHLLFNPRRGDVKLTQLGILLAEIDRVVEFCRVKGDHCNVVLCGDFNSVPNMPLYQLITTGLLHYHGLPAWMVSGQEDLSDKTHLRRLFCPLWPSSLGISASCQYTAGTGKQSQEPAGNGRQSQESGKLQYKRDFLLQLRFCEAACARPQGLELIPGVTDNTADPKEKHPCSPRLRPPICHGLNLQSTYSHFIPGTGRDEVTTLHAEGGATVDYIFYSGGRGSSSDHKGGAHLQSGGLKLLGRLSLLSEEDLWSLKGLPNEIFPSDHLSLLAKFQLDMRPA